MSLLDAGQETVLVWPEVDGADGDGNPVKVPSASPVRVRGMVQPVSSDESAVTGDAVATIYRLYARSFPAGAYARIEWDGRTWDVDGEPMRHGISASTRHVKVLLRARRPEVR